MRRSLVWAKYVTTVVSRRLQKPIVGVKPAMDYLWHNYRGVHQQGENDYEKRAGPCT